MQCATCDPNDDCTCDQKSTLNKYGYHLQDADDQRGYWYALGVQIGMVPVTAASRLDHDQAMISRMLREYGYR